MCTYIAKTWNFSYYCVHHVLFIDDLQQFTDLISHGVSIVSTCNSMCMEIHKESKHFLFLVRRELFIDQ